MVDGDGIVERMAVVQQRRFAVHALQDEVLVEPCDMPDLPTHRVDDAQSRPHELFVVEILDELPGTRIRIVDVRFEGRGRDLRDGGNPGGNEYRAVAREIADDQGMDPREETALNISVITPAAKRSRSGNRATAVRWARILERLGHVVQRCRDMARRSAIRAEEHEAPRPPGRDPRLAQRGLGGCVPRASPVTTPGRAHVRHRHLPLPAQPSRADDRVDGRRGSARGPARCSRR